MTFITADDQSTPLKLFLYLIDCWVNFFWLIPKRTQKFTAWWLHESSRERCSTKKDVLSNFAKSTGKHLCQSLFFDKVADLRPATSKNIFFTEHLWATASDCKYFSNPFQANVIFLHPLKTSEKFWFSEVFKGVKRENIFYHTWGC